MKIPKIGISANNLNSKEYRRWWTGEDVCQHLHSLHICQFDVSADHRKKGKYSTSRAN